MQVEEIHLRNFMCFNEVHLKLKNLCSFITGNATASGKSALITAVKFIVSAEYINSNVAVSLMPHYGSRGYVKIKFLVKDEEDEPPRELIAVRTFSNLNIIYYNINETQCYESVKNFQIIFKTNSEVCYPMLDLSVNCFPENKNLLHFWKVNSHLHSIKSLKEATSNLQSLLEAGITRPDSNRIALSQQRLIVDFERFENFRTFVNLTNLINTVFRVLTSEICSVQFFIEDNGELLNFTYSNFCDKTLSEVVTFIKFGENSLLWTSVQGHLKCLLKIAAKIAITKYFEHKFIFIENMDMLKQNQNIELAKLAIITQHLPEISTFRRNKYNFLQNIVDVCNRFKLNAFFEYRGVVTVENANVVQCAFKRSSAACQLVQQNLSLEDLVNVFEKYFDP